MKAVFQRVSRASVMADGVKTGEIARGALVLLGVGKEDTAEDAALLAKKIVNMRVYEDENDRMNLSLLDIGGGVLAVSNFTLYGDCRKGRRPDFTSAGAPDEAKALYECFVKELSVQGAALVETGVFGADMTIDMAADGPVTLVLDSEELKAPRRQK